MRKKSLLTFLSTALLVAGTGTSLPMASAVAAPGKAPAGKAFRSNLYIVELADASGNVLGMSAPFTLGAVKIATVSVVAVAPGAVTTGAGAGFSLFGLGPVSSVAVLGAAGAAAVTAVVATRQDASPSR